MLDKIKKYKILFILMFILFLYLVFNTNTVYGATTNVKFTIGTERHTVPFDFNLDNYCVLYDEVSKDILLYTTTNEGFYIQNNGKYLYFWSNTSWGARQTVSIYAYDSSNNSFTYKGRNNSTGSPISIRRQGKLHLVAGNCTVYILEDQSGCNEIGNMKLENVLPDVTIEFNENTKTWWVWTEWYDIRDFGTLSNFYAYGRHEDIDVNNPEECWQWSDFKYEYKKNEEGKETITREGFELWCYGFYSYCLWNVESGDWTIKGIDWTEESLKGTEAEGCLDPFKNLNLYLDDTSNTPTVYSNFIEKGLLDKCNLVDFSVSFDNGESFSSVVIDCKEERTFENSTYIRFYYKLYANDTYTFRLKIYDENYEEYVVTKTFTINSYNQIIDKNGSDTLTATPFITPYADSSIIRFSTQTFKERITLNVFEDTPVTSLRYDAYYIDEEAYQVFGDNYQDWILMEVGYEDYDKITEGYPYYFKTEFSFDSLEDGDKFYFVFYDKKLGCFSNVTTYVLESKSDLYTISQNITFNNDKFNRLYKFFEEHFGFLNYPLEFIINLFNRIFNINYEEPILHIPQLKVPTSNEVIFNGLDYNLRDVLKYPAVSNVYNIYLIAVDFCLIIYFIIHTKNTLEGVLSSNG